MPRSAGRSRDLRAALLLIAVAICFWAPWLARGRIPVPVDQQSWMLPWAADQPPLQNPAQWQAFWWDGVAQFYPWRLQLHRWFRRGQWPLWNAQQFCGYPFVGNGQSAMFYPPNWLYALIHPRRGFALLACIHSALALLLTLAYCRIIGLQRGSACYAAIAFAFGGFMVGWTPLPTATNCVTWLPGCLLGIELTARGRAIRGLVTLAACVGFSILAGHLQISTYVLLAAAGYGLARLVHLAHLRRPLRLGWYAAGAALGMCLAAPQLLPSLELGALSSRGAAVADEAGYRAQLQWALKPAELVTLLLPDALGNPARGDYWGFAYGERCGYLGVLTVLLAVLALVLLGPPWRYWFALAAVLALWGAMGGPPARLIYFGVPKVGLAGGFVRLLSVYTFLAAVLGALGLEAVRNATARATHGTRRLGRGLDALALVILLLDLFSWAWRTLPSGPADRLYGATEAVNLVAQTRTQGERVLALTPRTRWSLTGRPCGVLPPNSATAYENLQSVHGYDSLIPANYRRFASWVESDQDPSPLANGNMVLLENTASPLLALAGVSWHMAEETSAVPEAGADVVRRTSGLVVTHTRRVFPRAFLTSLPISGGRPELEALAQHPPGPESVATWAAPEGCNSLVLRAPRRAQPLTLVITNTWYPGWRAWNSGAPLRVQPVGGTFQGVELPAGAEGLVFLAYVPGTVQVGMFTFLGGAAVLAGLVGWRWVTATPGQRPLRR